MNYVALLKEDLNLLDTPNDSKVNKDWILKEFKNILVKSHIPEEEILLASLIGSYAKGSATKYSDIDFKFYTKNFSGDIWFPYKGKIVSIFADKLDDIKNLITKTSDLVWYSELLNTSVTLINRQNTKEHLISLVNDVNANKNINIVNTEIRRVIEYRRKIYSLVSKGVSESSNWQLTYIDFCKKYINNYLACLGYLNDSKVYSESSYTEDIAKVVHQKMSFYLVELLRLDLPIDERLESLEESYKIFCLEVFKYTKKNKI